jgi:hypothetical protein
VNLSARDRRELLLLLLATPLLPALALLPGGTWLLPALAPLTLYPGFARAVRERRYEVAFRRGLAWAAMLSIGVILLVRVSPPLAAAGILNSEPYRQEMFAWIETGIGRETDWRAFLPQHLFHLALFVVLTWGTGGYFGLALGAALTAYMSYFVGSFSLASTSPILGAIAAWVPWSVVRVAAFVALGTILSRPLLVRRWTPPFERREVAWILAAGTGILVDIVGKAALAPAYGRLLRSLLAASGP